jgi:hypothetical protein
MLPGNRLEPQQAGELAFVGALVVEAAPPHDLDRPPDARDAPGQPHLAVGPHANLPDQLVVGHGRGRTRLGDEKGWRRRHGA